MISKSEVEFVKVHLTLFLSTFSITEGLYHCAFGIVCPSSIVRVGMRNAGK